MNVKLSIIKIIILLLSILIYSNYVNANTSITLSEQININDNIYSIETSIPIKYQQAGIIQKLSFGKSNFSGSIASRVHNIITVAKQFDGTIIKKGETFSFNQILKSVHARYGYVKDQIIKGGSIIWEQGGGVCQLSTTILRAAMNAGLEIQNFRNHTYAIPYYKPYGLDSAIYMPYLDLKFKNNSPGDIYIQTMIIDSELIAIFYGSNDGRKVDIKGPFINQNIKESQLSANLNLVENSKKLDYKKFIVQYIRTIEHKSGEKIKEIFTSKY